MADVKRLERVQRKATNAENLKHLSYEERLDHLGLPHSKNEGYDGT